MTEWSRYLQWSILVYTFMYGVYIGSTMSMWRLCDLSSAGKFGRGKAEAKEDKPHNLLSRRSRASTTDITSVNLVAGSGC